MGTEFPWRWGRGTISANLDVIWGMSAKGYGFWNPATGRIDVAPAELAQIRLDPKFQKGRDRNNRCSEPVTRTVQLGRDGEAGHVLEAVE